MQEEAIGTLADLGKYNVEPDILYYNVITFLRGKKIKCSIRIKLEIRENITETLVSPERILL